LQAHGFVPHGLQVDIHEIIGAENFPHGGKKQWSSVPIDGDHINAAVGEMLKQLGDLTKIRLVKKL